MTETPTYDDAAVYRVVVARPATFQGLRLRPRDQIEVTGAALKQLIEQEGADVVVAVEG